MARMAAPFQSQPREAGAQKGRADLHHDRPRDGRGAQLARERPASGEPVTQPPPKAPRPKADRNEEQNGGQDAEGQTREAARLGSRPGRAAHHYGHVVEPD